MKTQPSEDFGRLASNDDGHEPSPADTSTAAPGRSGRRLLATLIMCALVGSIAGAAGTLILHGFIPSLGGERDTALAPLSNRLSKESAIIDVAAQAGLP